MKDRSTSNNTPRLRTLTDGCTVVPAGDSGVSGVSGWLVEHHRTSVLAGFTIKRFEAIHVVISSICKQRLGWRIQRFDHGDRTDTTEHRQHKNDIKVHVFRNLATSAIYMINRNGPRTDP